MLRVLFGGQGEELMGDLMNVHNEELLDTNSSNIIWEIKSKGKEYRSTWHVEGVGGGGKEKYVQRFGGAT